MRPIVGLYRFITDHAPDRSGGCEHYAVAIHRFLLSAPRTFGIDFSERKLVGLGHSLGANALWVFLHNRDI